MVCVVFVGDLLPDPDIMFYARVPDKHPFIFLSSSHVPSTLSVSSLSYQSTLIINGLSMWSCVGKYMRDCLLVKPINIEAAERRKKSLESSFP